MEIDIPEKAKRPETQEAMKEFFSQIAEKGSTKPGIYKGEPVLYSRLGDAVIIRRTDGEFLTFLDANGGGAAMNLPEGL